MLLQRGIVCCRGWFKSIKVKTDEITMLYTAKKIKERNALIIKFRLNVNSWKTLHDLFVSIDIVSLITNNAQIVVNNVISYPFVALWMLNYKLKKDKETHWCIKMDENSWEHCIIFLWHKYHISCNKRCTYRLL